DAHHFRRLAEQALTGEDLLQYETALAAYSGELLPEDRYEDWAAGAREALATLQLRLLLGLAALLEREGSLTEAIDRLQQALGVDATREDIHRSLMRLYALARSRHQAMRQYQACRNVLREELDADPEA